MELNQLLKKPDLITELKKEEIIQLLLQVKKQLAKQPKLIKLRNFQKIIFIGDIHGDFEATKIVIKKYLKKENALVFLGDYVDRGPQPLETINFLLFLKINLPNIFLLMGNHEAYPILPCYPDNFWEEIKNLGLYSYYADVLINLPLALSVKNILAVHAGLPEIRKIEEINQARIEEENKIFFPLIWDDFKDQPGEYLEMDPLTGRSSFGEDYFDKVMKKINKDVLIRGHDYVVKGSIFHDRCLTLFTSDFYADRGIIKGRLVAIADLDKKIETVNDLKIEKV